MDQYHKPHNKKVSSGTGGRRRKFRDKKIAHVGGVFSATKVAESETKVKVRKRGGSTRPKVKKAAFINVITKSGTKKVKIKKLLDSHNKEYIRTNIITRGAVVETEIGKVRVTNRVGQDGVVNGVLVS
ncbi:MAG: 30S ribosomal protein S8e [Candidatus Bilamarchaeum sp.]|jgi:small subunit ribosomal protein S8e